MRKLLLIILMTVGVLIAFNSQNKANAYTVTDEVCNGGNASNSSVCQTGAEDPITGSDGIIIKITKILSYIIGFIAVLMIIISGIKFATSNGNSESITSARNTLLYALIGIAIAGISPLIIRFVISII